jgi:hypothetical protein
MQPGARLRSAFCHSSTPLPNVARGGASRSTIARHFARVNCRGRAINYLAYLNRGCAGVWCLLGAQRRRPCERLREIDARGGGGRSTRARPTRPHFSCPTKAGCASRSSGGGAPFAPRFDPGGMRAASRRRERGRKHGFHSRRPTQTSSDFLPVTNTGLLAGLEEDHYFGNTLLHASFTSWSVSGDHEGEPPAREADKNTGILNKRPRLRH